jgi:hypothetical protein
MQSVAYVILYTHTILRHWSSGFEGISAPNSCNCACYQVVYDVEVILQNFIPVVSSSSLNFIIGYL